MIRQVHAIRPTFSVSRCDHKTIRPLPCVVCGDFEEASTPYPLPAPEIDQHDVYHCPVLIILDSELGNMRGAYKNHRLLGSICLLLAQACWASPASYSRPSSCTLDTTISPNQFEGSVLFLPIYDLTASRSAGAQNRTATTWPNAQLSLSTTPISSYVETILY